MQFNSKWVEILPNYNIYLILDIIRIKHNYNCKYSRPYDNIHNNHNHNDDNPNPNNYNNYNYDNNYNNNYYYNYNNSYPNYNYNGVSWGDLRP